VFGARALVADRRRMTRRQTCGGNLTIGKRARILVIFFLGFLPMMNGPSINVTAEIRTITLLDQAPFYEPGPAVRIAVGETVRWINPMRKDGAVHTVTHQGCYIGDPCEFDSGLLAPGERFSHTFAQVGTYGYRCRLHAFMEGSIVVEERAASGSQARTAALAQPEWSMT
jgi:plastocyanin